MGSERVRSNCYSLVLCNRREFLGNSGIVPLLDIESMERPITLLTDENLREAVGRSLYLAAFGDTPFVAEGWDKHVSTKDAAYKKYLLMADAAIAIVATQARKDAIEEAAKVADTTDLWFQYKGTGDFEGNDIANAIRALLTKENENA